MECLLIAESLRTDHQVDVHFLLNPFAPGLSAVRERGFSFELYLDETYHSDPFERVPDIIRASGALAAVIDVPALFVEELERLTRAVEPVVLILDNDENQIFPVAALVNYNVSQDPDFYASSPGVRCYIGTTYVPLCRTRLDRAKLSTGKKIRMPDVVITMGGTDPNRLSLKVLEAIRLIDPGLSICVVVGSGAPDSARRGILAWLAANELAWELHDGMPQEEFFELLATASLVVSAAGNTLYELSYLGVPTAALAENEATLRVAQEFAARGWCTSLGLGTELSIETLAGRLLSVLGGRQGTAVEPALATDGRGVERIATIVAGVLPSPRAPGFDP
jgi:spore coat polysaccharide biosynthesis predicted glycosyltransferase SpsG